jgi:hypothetical protein
MWAGGGTVGPSSRRLRARHYLRTVLSEHPTLYLPIARKKYPGPSPKVIGPQTEAVIDGYTRSASTFAVYAFQLAQQRLVPLAHHLHAPAQLMEAARRGLPTLMVIREPKGAVLSQMVREPDVDLLDALIAYRRFHASLQPYRSAFLIADFADVTQDFGAVVRQMNLKFGTAYGLFEGTPAQVAECTRMIGLRPTLSPVLLGFESGEVTLEAARAYLAGTSVDAPTEALWAPSAARNAAKAALGSMWSNPALSEARLAAEDAYAAFTIPSS